MFTSTSGDYESAANTIRREREYKSDQFQVPNREIQLQLALGDFPTARDIVHSTLSKYIDKDMETSRMAFYEMVIGDTTHAEEIYARLAAVPDPPGLMIFNPNKPGGGNLYWDEDLIWGMLGAVNLAYLHTRNGDTRAARELLVKAREYIVSRSAEPRFFGGIPYVLAQIAAVEGNNDAAIEYLRKAVDAGWSRAWFGRIDPIMADLRTDARYMQILEELEEKLLEMREHPKTLASAKP